MKNFKHYILLFVIAFSFGLKVNANPIVEIHSDKPLTLCKGDSVYLTANICTGCAAPYTYQWMKNDTILIDSVQSIKVKSSGAYCVKVTCGSGCKITQCVRVTIGFPFYQAVVTTPTCLFANNGRIEIKSLSINPCRKYQITAGTSCAFNQLQIQTSSIFTGLSSGNYCIKVIDICNNCDTCICVFIPQPVGTGIANVTNVTCYGGNNGAITFKETDSTFYQNYLWSNGATNATIANITAGNYTVTSTNTEGCTLSNLVVVTQPPALAINASITPVSCQNTNTGSISITVSGGTPTYTYLWNSNSTSAIRSGLTAGTYTVTVTDFKGCTKTNSTTIIALNAIPAQPATISGPVAVCKNSLVTYSIPPMAGATSYTWTTTSGATVNSGQGSATVVISFSNNSGNASLSVKANNICGSGVARTLAYTVSSVIPASPASITGPLYGLCNLTSVTYSCPSVPNATSYLWTVPAGVTILTGQGTNSITVKYTGTFNNTGSLSVVAQSGCGNSAACTRTVNAKPQQPVITGQNWACKNQPGLVYSVAPVSGATSYTWTIVPGSTLVSGQGTTSIVVNWGNVNGQIKCAVNNACGSSLQALLPVSFTCKEEGDLFDFSELSLYPNPTSASVTLQFDGFADGKGQLMVFDLVGQEVLSKALSVYAGDNSYQLDLSSFPKGIYSIRVIYNGMTRNEKLIVQ